MIEYWDREINKLDAAYENIEENIFSDRQKEIMRRETDPWFFIDFFDAFVKWYQEKSSRAPNER